MLVMHGFGGAPILCSIVAACGSIPVARSFIGLSVLFFGAASSCGDVAAFCLQTFQPLSVRHGPWILFLLSMRTLSTSLGPLLLPLLLLDGPLVLTLGSFLTCHIRAHHYPSLLGFRTCVRAPHRQSGFVAGSSPGSFSFHHCMHHLYLTLPPHSLTSFPFMHQPVLLGIPCAGVLGASSAE